MRVCHDKTSRYWVSTPNNPGYICTGIENNYIHPEQFQEAFSLSFAQIITAIITDDSCRKEF